MSQQGLKQAIPAFNDADPVAWFRIYENYSSFYKYSNSDKISAVFASITQEQYMKAGLDVLHTAALTLTKETDLGLHYAKLKAHLISVFHKPAAVRARALLDLCCTPQSGAPEDVLYQMLGLFNPECVDEREDFSLHIFRELFLRTQPAKMTEWLEVDSALKPTDIYKSIRKRPHAALLSEPDRINAVQPPKPGDHAPRPRKTINPAFCFYHNRYGNKARKCAAGCTYKQAENTRAGRQ